MSNPITVKAGPLGMLIDVLLPAGSKLSDLVAELAKGDSADKVQGRQAYIQGAKVADGFDPVLKTGQMIMFNGKIKGNLL